MKNKLTKKQVKELDISPCNGCKCITHSIRKGKAYYVCGKCGYDKSLSDVYWYEAMQKNKVSKKIKKKKEIYNVDFCGDGK